MIIPLNSPRSFRIPDHPSVKPEYVGIEVPVSEAPWPLPILPTEEDIANAIPNDPYYCMYAVNIRRVWNAAFVAIEHGVCGVVMRDEDGNLCFYRWFLTAGAKDNTKMFDAGKKTISHVGLLRPARPSETLANKAVAHLKWELKQARKEKQRQKQRRPSPKQKTSTKPKRKAHVIGSMRALSSDQMQEVAAVETRRKSGKGMFQFKPFVPEGDDS